MGLGGREDETEYPEKPEEPDYIYYLRTGCCGYEARCRFIHPRDRVVVSFLVAFRPLNVSTRNFQYYMRTGTCKFGASWKYHHPKQALGLLALVAVNCFGYPLRSGKKECIYYIKMG
ncbi:Zinc finger CCCH domain-containing protein 34 [Linum perenne]